MPGGSETGFQSKVTTARKTKLAPKNKLVMVNRPGNPVRVRRVRGVLSVTRVVRANRVSKADIGGGIAVATVIMTDGNQFLSR